MGGNSLAMIFLRAAANPDLLEEIQAVAHKEGRMANQMVERAIATLDALAEGKEVSDEDLDYTKQLLEFVSKGSLVYVERLRRSRVPHFP